jgi:hypothetical protein
VHARGDLAVLLLGDRQQLDRVPESLGEGDVALGDVGDTFAVDISGDDARVEGDTRKDRCLRRRVEALDIGGRIEFGVTEPLRLGQRLPELQTLLGHARQDEVRRAVDDAHHLVDPLAGERLLQRVDERDAAADRRLVVQVHPGRVGCVEQLLPERGEQLLVGGHDALAVGDRVQEQTSGRLDASHHLHDDVHVGIGHDRARVGRQQDLGACRDVAFLAQVADGDGDQVDLGADALLDLGAVGSKDPQHRRPDDAAPELADPDDPAHRAEV